MFSEILLTATYFNAEFEKRRGSTCSFSKLSKKGTPNLVQNLKRGGRGSTISTCNFSETEKNKNPYFGVEFEKGRVAKAIFVKLSKIRNPNLVRNLKRGNNSGEGI